MSATVAERLSALEYLQRSALATVDSLRPDEELGPRTKARLVELNAELAAGFESIVSDELATPEQIGIARACASALGGLSPEAQRAMDRAFPLRRGKLAQKDAAAEQVRALRGERA